jgi:hypothetical protein
LVAGLLLSNLFTLGAMALLFLVSVPRVGERTAFYGCLFLLTFPLGFFLGLVYTESLFLFLVLLLFWGVSKGRPLPSIVGAYLAPLSRPTGLLLGLPIAVLAWKKKDKGSFLILAAWLAGELSYWALMNGWTGDPFTGFTAQNLSIGHFSILNLLHPWDWFTKNFFRTSFTWLAPGTSLLDRIYFVGFLGILGLAWKELLFWERAYCLVLGLVPAVSGDLMSYGRYLLVLFPLFWVLSKRFVGREWIFWGTGILFQVYLILRHSLNGFVA